MTNTMIKPNEVLVTIDANCNDDVENESSYEIMKEILVCIMNIDNKEMLNCIQLKLNLLENDKTKFSF